MNIFFLCYIYLVYCTKQYIMLEYWKGGDLFMAIPIIVIILVVICIIVVSMYNNLVSLRQRVQNAWSQIDVQLKRRFDLIPNLQETVKGYMAHESETFSKIAELRTAWASSNTVAEKAEISNQLTDALKTIMAVSENYPDLKASESFLGLQDELRNTENKIAYSRQFYNDTVTMYNTKLEMFPSNLIAKAFNFKASELFEVKDEQEKQNVKIDFSK
jgi:LemA protein